MKIVVLSRNPNLYSTKRLVEAGKKRNHEMLIIDHTKCDIIIERKKPAIRYKHELITDVDAVIPRIGASVTFFGTAVVRQFEMMKVFTAVESQALMRSRDKLRSLQVLSRAGLGLPKTVFTNYSKNVDDVIESVGGAPLVIKILEGTQGLGVVLAETHTAATSVLEAFNGLKARVIAQEFVKEDSDLLEVLNVYVKEAYESLERTPELLAVLKESGVVDSGGAGFNVVIDGMILAFKYCWVLIECS